VDDANPFGRCCEDLRQAMHKKEHSMFGVENGILFLNIGIVQMTSQTGYFMKPVRFCPFCGTELQSAENLADWGKRR
jgi:NADH pyrophosphatase NudC (nudix superfamily)